MFDLFIWVLVQCPAQMSEVIFIIESSNEALGKQKVPLEAAFYQNMFRRAKSEKNAHFHPPMGNFQQNQYNGITFEWWDYQNFNGPHIQTDGQEIKRTPSPSPQHIASNSTELTIFVEHPKAIEVVAILGMNA
jgi:hypothetical protein